MHKVSRVLSVVIMIACIDGISQSFLYMRAHNPSWQIFGSRKLYNDITTDNPYIPYMRSSRPASGNGTNTRGLRGKDIDFRKKSNEIRILCLGSSTTVDQPDFEKSWPGLIEKKLSKRYPDRKITVLVQAHGAYLTSDNLVTYALRSQDYNVDLVIIYDGWTDITPSTTKNFESDYSHSRQRVPEYLKYSKIIAGFQDKYPFMKYSGTAGLLFYETREYEIRKYNEALWKSNGSPSQGVWGVDTFRRNIETVETLSKANGSKVVFITQVEREKAYATDRDSRIQHMIHEEHKRMAKEVAKALNTGFFDLAAVYPQDERYYTDRIHFSEAGSELAAEKICDYLGKNGLVGQWNRNGYKRRSVFAMNYLDKTEKIGDYRGNIPPAFTGADSGGIKKAVFEATVNPDVETETGYRIPLGYLSGGRHVVGFSIGYDRTAYRKDLTRGGGIKFIARLMVSGGKTVPVMEQTLFPGKNYKVGEFMDITKTLNLPEGSADLELLTAPVGNERNRNVQWECPVLRLTQ